MAQRGKRHIGRRPTVALLIESSRAYGRGLLRGIARYVRETARWNVLHQERSLSDAAPAWLTHQACDGVIARVESPQLLEQLSRLRLPVVDVRGVLECKGIPRVLSDDGAIAVMAAEHLLDRGLRNLAFCGFGGADYSRRRQEAFCRRVSAAGYAVEVFNTTAPLRRADTQRIEAAAIAGENKIRRWLKRLPTPVGIMACNDICGRMVLDACLREALRAPESVAVVGVDNDDVLCDLSSPPLSSVQPDCDGIGYRAAALLARMIHGGNRAARSLYIAPTGIVTRLSTDMLAVDDRLVAEALAFIRRSRGRHISVEHILDHLADSGLTTSRSTLERRFAEHLKRSPRDEIARAAMERARELLLGTGLPLQRIAESVGLAYSEYFIRVFKQRYGVTPGEFRRRAGR